jgi:hypothetical protein
MSRTTPVQQLARVRWVFLSVLLLVIMVFAGGAQASTAKVGPPSSIDALGDSITCGYDSQGTGCGTLADCPANSWATGTNSGVNSYYMRVKALNRRSCSLAP